MERFIDRLIKVEDASTETFELFTNLTQDGSNLGMLAPEQDDLQVSIGPQDFEIAQSPGLLKSNHPQGTTGAAVWQSGVRLSRWLQLPNSLLQCMQSVDSPSVLELGAGVSGLVSCVLASKLGEESRVIASDMAYAQKLLRLNVDNHQFKAQKSQKSRRSIENAHIEVVELDWERTDAVSLLRSHDLPSGVDLVVACDCVYNYALIQPFLDTCSSICSMRSSTPQLSITLCIVVQQLRQPDVFEEWLEHALATFNVWKLPEETVGKDLSAPSGYSVHALRLK